MDQQVNQITVLLNLNFLYKEREIDMGLDVNGTRFLLMASQSGADFSQFAMIGRQKMHLMPNDLKQLMDGFGHKYDMDAINKMLTEDNRFAEPFIKAIGGDEVVSFDASSYENATYVHDMNLPIPDNYKEKYTSVLDGGSLEHIFNFPVAIKNCMQMLKVGGQYLGITPVNNFMGHGFYQFSPELYYRIFSEQNGFKVQNMTIFEDKPGTSWLQLTDPEILKRRVELVNSTPTYILVQAVKLENKNIFEVTPQQSDYANEWSKA